MASNYANAMASLNQYCQKNDFTLVYNTVSVEGPSHDRVFTVTVSVNNKMYTPATGKSKKEAKGLAAELAWKTIEQEEQADSASRQRSLPSPSPPQTPQASRSAADLSRVSALSSEASTSSLGASPLPSVPYISLLNEYKQKNKVDIDYIWGNTSGRDHMPIFSVACKIGSNVFPEGTGSTKQAAKCNAARLACEQLNILPTSRTEQSATPSSNVGDTLSSSSEEVSEASENATDSGFGYKNAVDSLGDGLLAVKLNETSLASPKGAVIKPKRKETPLAPKFSNLGQRESEYTENERFLKEYKDIKSIGTGGFGDVFKAKHAIDDSIHAIKRVVFSCEETAEGEKAKREVQVLAKLEHENIVRYYTCWIGEDKSENSLGKTCMCLFIDMEFCENTLEAWISENVQRHEDALKKFQQIVEGVEYIHFQNIIHRDLKPANIFISRDNKIKIGDFGLATSDIDGRSVERTKNTGTKSYMAPEQVRSKYGKEVDLFSLGLIFFEMICGFEKWFALTAHERTKKWQSIRDRKFPQEFVQKFPKEKSIISKLLSEPPQRPSASELLRFLKNNVDRGYTC